MPGGFADSPRKRVVREQWNTPVLQQVSRELEIKYLYFGLPGKEILDVRLWRDMIRRIIAFEIEDLRADNEREDLVEMTRNLALLGIPNQVYCGYVEHVLIFGEDDDGQVYDPDDLVTLYNLDFCNAITGKAPTRQGRTCLRLEAMRHLFELQHQRSIAGDGDRFVLLLTCQDQFHHSVMQGFLDDSDMPTTVEAWVQETLATKPLGTQPIQCNTPLLKAFVFSTLQTYAQELNISTCFLPMISYFGRTRRSRMVHFTILCRFAALPTNEQPAEDFLRRVSATTDWDGTELTWPGLGPMETECQSHDFPGLAAEFLSA